MTNQEILDNAPEGATHINTDGDYHKIETVYQYEDERDCGYEDRFRLSSSGDWVVGHDGLLLTRSLADIKRIAELENQWISVEDKLPDELQSVLSFASYDGVFQSNYRAGNFKKTLVVWEHLNVTHWMPLPSPPKEQY